jgi:hypothetical protein
MKNEDPCTCHPEHSRGICYARDEMDPSVTLGMTNFIFVVDYGKSPYNFYML